jgi:enamine deaminase RidA (YjgF/YER057c/UK114 family)
MRKLMAGLLALAVAVPGMAQTPEERLKAAGHVLPAPPRPIGVYAPAVRVGTMLWVSGHGECGEQTRGKLGAGLSLEAGRASAERVGLCVLATIKAAVGDLGKVERIVKVTGFVNAYPDFRDHPRVMNGFSELMVAAFGDGGRAARSSVGVASLPGDMAVEVEAVVLLKE